jgi:hypothetical protein
LRAKNLKRKLIYDGGLYNEILHGQDSIKLFLNKTTNNYLKIEEQVSVHVIFQKIIMRGSPIPSLKN